MLDNIWVWVLWLVGTIGLSVLSNLLSPWFQAKYAKVSDSYRVKRLKSLTAKMGRLEQLERENRLHFEVTRRGVHAILYMVMYSLVFSGCFAALGFLSALPVSSLRGMAISVPYVGETSLILIPLAALTAVIIAFSFWAFRSYSEFIDAAAFGVDPHKVGAAKMAQLAALSASEEELTINLRKVFGADHEEQPRLPKYAQSEFWKEE